MDFSRLPNMGTMPTVTAEPRYVDSTGEKWERTYATFQHLTLLVAPAALLGAIAAVVMWLLKREESPFLDDHGKESVNFQISIVIYSIAAGALTPVIIGIPLVAAVVILALIGMVKAARAAHRGEYFRYPMCLRLLD